MNKYYNNKRNKTPDEKVQSVLNMVNVIPTFIQQWQQIHMRYEDFHWTDKLTDSEKIEEYKDINANYQAYIKKKKNIVKDNIDKPETLSKIIEGWIKTPVQQPKTGWSRKFLVYMTLKEQWLIALKHFVDELIIKEEE